MSNTETKMKGKSTILSRLRQGETVEIEGLFFHGISGEIQTGDIYIAERNTGPKLLWCKEHNHDKGIVFPTTLDYPFDTYECVKVQEQTPNRKEKKGGDERGKENQNEL